MQEGSHADTKMPSFDIWKDAPFYKVEKASERLISVCDKVDPNIITYRLFPGKKSE